ncbi:ABC transporter permease [Bifidobacterium italicum]|uniref:ABC transporter permease n=1 Tax=Bifidobacterium italicum TaxID=1960968 RepID=A0A2A2EIC7_9BIFI|nr:ABC transporter permease [Bifidobacterium italicum]PAU68720.1 ABC transporter permease [Bifidobacterium italicum]
MGAGPGAHAASITGLTAAVATYAPVFLSLFAGMLLARDRTSSFLSRLFVSPMTAADFILGYTAPMLAVSLVQSLITFVCAGLFGYRPSVRLLFGVVVILPMALMCTAIGLLCGCLMSDRAVGGVCGAMLTTVSFILSVVTVPVAVMGPAFRHVAQALPFYNATQATIAAVGGGAGLVWPHLRIVCPYALECTVAAVGVFAWRRRER